MAANRRRMADRDALNGTRSAESQPRYTGSQQIYFREARPWERASLVVDNADFNEPRVIGAARADRRTLRYLHRIECYRGPRSTERGSPASRTSHSGRRLWR